MRSWVGKAGILFICAAILAGCGGGSKANNTVTQVTLSPSSVSLVSGDVAQLSVTAQNSAGTGVVATVTYTSSNPNLVTVSTGGLVCAGVWDSAFVVCKGTDGSGNPLTGTANITATANGVNSTPIPVVVHLPVSSVIVDPVAGCTSTKLTKQFQAHACSTVAMPHDPGPPCGTAAKEITSLVGPFTWTTTNGTVGTVDANGLVTANAPGLMGVIARVGNVTSSAVPFRTCMPVAIRLHVQGDPPGSPTTSASLNATQTLTVEADMDDENGVTTNSAPVAIVSNNSTAASVSGVTLTAQSPGGAGLLAACIPPTCGAGINQPVYSNLFRVTVNGTSPATTVYASTTFAPPSGTTPTLVPIDTNTNTAGTAINLPGVPNSLVFTPNGAKGYLGTDAGLASLDTATNAVTLVAPDKGKVLAVSPDGNTVIVSNAPIETDVAKQRLVIFTANNNTVQNFVLPGAVAASFTGDNFKAFIGTNDGSSNVYVYSPFLTLQTLNSGGGSPVSVAALASGPFMYLANTAALNVFATCNNAQRPDLATTSAPQLVGAVKNADLIVVANASGLDIETVTVTPGATFCPPNVAYSNHFIDFGLGAFTARQLLVPSDGVGNNTDPANGTHIVVLPVGINKLLTAVPGGGPTIVTLAAGGTEALSGGLTLDGNTAWVGVAGSNTVDKIDLTGGSDTNQIATSFKKTDSTPAPPNIVAVKPK